jgi:hypothetical protein
MAEQLVHRTAVNASFGDDGQDPHWETICGKRVGSVEGMLNTGDPKAVTCPGCKGKRGNPRKPAA